eukprot:15365857-Ditylum_brightwellii.AAC.2
MKKSLDAVPDKLTCGYSRLLLEDYDMLDEGEEILCYISLRHSWLIDRQGSSQMLENIEDSLKLEPLCPMIIGKDLFFCLRLVVKNDPMKESFENGYIRRKEF